MNVHTEYDDIVNIKWWFYQIALCTLCSQLDKLTIQRIGGQSPHIQRIGGQSPQQDTKTDLVILLPQEWAGGLNLKFYYY